MVSTDRLIYLSLQKTACTHVNTLLTQKFGGHLTRPKHGRLPPGFPRNGRPIVGTIRDPWDWYVSLWAFGCTKRDQGGTYKNTTNREFRHLLSKGQASPSQRLVGFWRECRKSTAHWKRVYRDPNDADAFRQWLRMMFDRRYAYDVNLDYAASTLSEFAGLLTYWYAWLFSSDTEPLFGARAVRSVAELQEFDREHNLVDIMLRNETLAGDLLALLRKVGYNLDDSTLAGIGGERRTNTSNHRAAAYYYDEESRDLVAQHEAFIIAKYGYQPPLI